MPNITSAMTIKTNVESILFFCIQKGGIPSELGIGRWELHLLSHEEEGNWKNNDEEIEWIHSREREFFRRRNDLRFDCWLSDKRSFWSDCRCRCTCFYEDSIRIGSSTQYGFRSLERDRSDKVLEGKCTILDQWAIFPNRRDSSECIGTSLLKLGFQGNTHYGIICFRTRHGCYLDSAIIALLGNLELQCRHLDGRWELDTQMHRISHFELSEIESWSNRSTSRSRDNSWARDLKGKNGRCKKRNKKNHNSSQKSIFHIWKMRKNR